MANRKQYALWAALVAALLGLTAAALWHGPSRRLGGGTPASERGVVVPPADGTLTGLNDYGALPEFALVSQTGDSVHLRDLRGQVWIADFIFTHCAATCPMMTAQLQRLRTAFGGAAPVRLVSFSVDPDRDTPQRLTDYAAEYGATPDHWLFLTGDKRQLRRLSIDGFHLSVDDSAPEDVAKGAESVLHSTRFTLVDGQGHIRGYYDGTTNETVDQLGVDARKLAASSTP